MAELGRGGPSRHGKRRHLGQLDHLAEILSTSSSLHQLGFIFA